MQLLKDREAEIAAKEAAVRRACVCVCVRVCVCVLCLAVVRFQLHWDQNHLFLLPAFVSFRTRFHEKTCVVMHDLVLDFEDQLNLA